MAPERLVLIGAHLEPADVDGVAGVTPLALEIPEEGAEGAIALTLSSVAFDPAHGIADREVLLRAATVRGELAARATYVAIRYGVTVSNADEARGKVAAFAKDWHQRLVRYRGHVEMTLKIGSATEVARPAWREFDSGRAYLEALHKARAPRPIDAGFRAAIDRIAESHAVEQRWIDREDGGVEIALLVRREDGDAVADSARALCAQFPSIPFLLSGPWPLEVFAHD